MPQGIVAMAVLARFEESRSQNVSRSRDFGKSQIHRSNYMIRNLPANARDANFCLRLGHPAVHAGMGARPTPSSVPGGAG
jgi:hypothetical protein